MVIMIILLNGDTWKQNRRNVEVTISHDVRKYWSEIMNCSRFSKALYDYLVFPMTFAMFVDTSSLDKLIARTTTVSHFAVGEVLSVEEQLGGESTSSNANN